MTCAPTGRPPGVLPIGTTTAGRPGSDACAIQKGWLSYGRSPSAGALGVMPNALYTYFPDKAAILDAVLDGLLGEVERPGPRTSWRAGLVELMRSYRRLLLAQPGLIALTVSRPMLGPNALRLREDMLTLLGRGRLDDAEAVSAFLALFAFTTGFVAYEAARKPGELDAKQRDQASRLYATLNEDDFPSTRALARRLAKRPGDAEFARGLHGLVAGFAPA
ncbi:MAG: TetR/AcrR family transcriptional regulator C-terminal domain-containing protein [Thermoleophilaceae bacterium]